MTGTIFDIKRLALNDGPGIRITVFFKGCPLKCWWCHNPEGQKPERESYYKKTLSGWEHEEKIPVGKTISSEEIMAAIDKEMVFIQHSDGGVTFSGGEPLMQAGFLEELLRMCRDKSIHTAVDTSGYAKREVFYKVTPLTDLFLFDLKIADEVLHKRYTGVSNKQIISNLYHLDKEKKDVIIRIPFVPGITNSQENMEGLRQVLSRLEQLNKIEIIPYHKIAASKYRRFEIENKMPGFREPEDNEMKAFIDNFTGMGFDIRINN